ncbi:MAG: sigma-70 family RNA polymerase sigma factor [Coprococcus sp.]|nr:sigma-70 family RNA polymerase sigma factor [Coprococcus sp.]
MTNEQLTVWIQAGEDTAENMLQLWEQNRGLIVKVAMKYRGNGEMDDLTQEGYLGLCEAVWHYDPERGAPFSSYAYFWIEHTIQRYIENCCRPVRILAHESSWIRKYNRASREYASTFGDEPSERALCALLGVSREKLHTIKESARLAKIRSLNEPTTAEDGELTLEDTVASGEDLEGDVIRACDREVMERELWIAVDRLPGERPGIIRKRYQEGKSLECVGREFGISRSRISEIERDALRKLRNPARCRKFRAYYEEYLAASTVCHVGVAAFQRTWESAVEKEVLYDLEGWSPVKWREALLEPPGRGRL